MLLYDFNRLNSVGSSELLRDLSRGIILRNNSNQYRFIRFFSGYPFVIFSEMIPYTNTDNSEFSKIENYFKLFTMIFLPIFVFIHIITHLFIYIPMINGLSDIIFLLYLYICFKYRKSIKLRRSCIPGDNGGYYYPSQNAVRLDYEFFVIKNPETNEYLDDDVVNSLFAEIESRLKEREDYEFKHKVSNSLNNINNNINLVGQQVANNNVINSKILDRMDYYFKHKR